jgi:homoserine kinase
MPSSKARSVTVKVPATVANMGPGFDSFGMAVSLYNTFTFSIAERDELILNEAQKKQADLINIAESVLQDSSTQLLWQACELVYQTCGKIRQPIAISMDCKVPMSRGLGSSSTAIIAALIAANALCQNLLSQETLLDLAIQIEHHPDNVAPALLGGVVFYDTQAYTLPWPSHWEVLTISPSYPVSTKEARTILPAQFSMADSVFNLRKASLLTYALLKADEKAFKLALEDRLHQPYRSQLIPEYHSIQEGLLKAGALGLIISGSGPTMTCFYSKEIKESLLQTLNSIINAFSVTFECHTLTIDSSGAKVLP